MNKSKIAEKYLFSLKLKQNILELFVLWCFSLKKNTKFCFSLKILLKTKQNVKPIKFHFNQ